ncbi:monocarboxylate transporter [Fusarium pseudocircinatum]|uniref:Monocarboxylate transporter n=1 Tax=Fusarium pseudocircinatum TaxID=56676 RepID=A0A8H5LA81_9HYPO|nr:monocarboxylate transporter [Fusarium pseudocircinatum]
MATNTVAESVTTSTMDPPRQGDAMEMSSLSQTPLSTAEDTVRNEEEPPENATNAIPDGGYGWTIVASCSILLFWINGYTTAWGVLQAAIVQSPRLHTNIRTITFVGSLYMACMVAFGLISVRLSREYGIRITSLVATIFFGSGLIITSFTLEHLAGLFCIAGLLVGLSTSLLYTATNTMPTQWFSRKLGTANGIVKAGGGVGATVLPLATQAMIDKVGLQWTFRILGASILLTGIPCAYLLTELRRGATTSRFDWSQLKSMPFLTLTMSGAVGVFALFVPPFFLPVFARSIGLSASTGAGLVAGFGASTAIGRLFGGWICDRMGAFNALALAALINSVSMLAIWPVSSSLPPLFAFAIINGCANGSFFVALPTAVAALAPGSAAASISLMTSFWTPGYLMGAPLAGILIDAAGASEASSIGPYRAAIFYAAGVGSAATFLIVLGDAAPSPMELLWLQNLNLLLARITGICQTSDWRKSVVDEAKRTLLCLACRRQLTGGQRVVTNEHLTRALHYFDVRMLVADVDYSYAGLLRDDFFRDYYSTCDEAPEDDESSSNNQPDTTSLTLPKPKRDIQNAAPSATATPIGIKRKASDDLRNERVNRTAARDHRARELGDMRP